MFETLMLFIFPFAIAFVAAICMAACSREMRQAMRDDWERK